MSKRKNTSSPEPETTDHYQKSRISVKSDDSQGSSPPGGYEQPLVNTATGQIGAFPGLTNNDELFYGPAVDGLDYLRMVRSEAKNIPQLLTAKQKGSRPNSDEYENDYDGFFDQDEAFIAAPVSAQEQENLVNKTQQAYYDSILVHFNLARATMNCTPALDRIQRLDPSIPISFPSASKSARRAWEKHIAEQYPHPIQIACMDADSVLELIRLMTKKFMVLFRSTDVDDIQRMGTWIWSMLAKFPERGSVGSEEIAELRALARRADTLWDWVQNRRVQNGDLQDPEVAAMQDDESEMSPESPEGMTEPKNDARGMQEVQMTKDEDMKSSSGVQVQKQQMILDMIMTVVGEVYGQRDLLEMRRPWVAMNH